MIFCNGLTAAAAVLIVAGSAWHGNAECAFRLDGYLYNEEPLTLTAPLVNPGSGFSVINPYNPLVYLVDPEIWDRYNVNCTVDSWRYQLAGGGYATNFTFPDSGDIANTTQVAFEELFAADGHNLSINSYPTDVAVAISDSLVSVDIEVFLTCDQEPVVADEDSCVLFNMNFTNSSPEPDAELLSSALYRFEEPAVPGVVLPAAVPYSPGDTWLNEGNPIVNINGTTTYQGCNGEIAEYQGEDGEWYFYWTGSDGQLYNLTHVFYTTYQDRLNVAIIQQPWSPNLENALLNRFVRLSIYCNNVNNRVTGYVLFKVGDGTPAFDLSVAQYELILDPTSAAGPRHAWGWGALFWSLFSFVGAGVSSLALAGAP
ncbi:unnamed protein product [Pylaiella littoralis]